MVAEGHQTTVAEGIVVTEDVVLARIHDLTPDHHVSCLLLSLHFLLLKRLACYTAIMKFCYSAAVVSYS